MHTYLNKKNLRILQDTTPPQMAFQGFLPPNQTAAAFANFTFNATDLASVSYQCRITVQQAAAAQGQLFGLQPLGKVLDNNIALDAWDACTSPLTIYWLLPGIIHIHPEFIG